MGFSSQGKGESPSVIRKDGMEHQYAPAGLSNDSAQEITRTLQERLADLIDLSLTLKHVHWNVIGFGFISIHKLMDEQTVTLRGLIDEVAERITTMGAVAAGLPTQVVEGRSAKGDYALGRGPVMAHLGALDKAYERVIVGHREAISAVAKHDPVSEDLLIGQTAKLDLNHWFIRAHLSDTEGRLATSGAESELDAAATAAELLQPTGEIESIARDDEKEPVPLT
jgi:starvation-inducible DNA-binding protein